MKKDTSEQAQLELLGNIMWNFPIISLSVEPGEEEKKTLLDAKGEPIKEIFTPYIFFINGQEVLRVKCGKINPANILLEIGGKPKNWSQKSLEHVLQDVLTLQDTITKFRADMLERSQQKMDPKYKNEDDATFAFLEQFMPKPSITI